MQRLVDTLLPVAGPLHPALIRIGTGVFSAVHQGRRRPMMHKLHRQDREQFVPVGVVKVLRDPLPPRLADALFDAAQVTNALYTLGIAHPLTGSVNAALQLWTLSYRNSWGMIFHNDNQLVMHQMVLGLTPSADALSADAWLRRRTLVPPTAARRYGGIPTALNLITSAVYFISGVAKVRSSQGWRWATGDALRDQIGADAIRKEVFGSQAPALAQKVYSHKGNFGALAVVALTVELGAPLSVCNRRVGQVFAVAAWGMHVGIRVMMGIKFKYNLSGIPYLSHVPIGLQPSPARSFLPRR